ncbi:SPJ_0845 family protein [uncultured Streptococcus sp.]|nr:SPJ_0845 family protein [uncultured Streptococcus sp.]
MAITHKRQDDLESMFASFASVPEPKVKGGKPKDGDKEDKKKD